MKSWEEQRQATLRHWNQVLAMLPEQEHEEVLKAVTRTTEFCEAADEMMGEFGGEVRCDMCAHSARYGSCLAMTHAVLEQLHANRWDRAQREVEGIISHLQSIA